MEKSAYQSTSWNHRYVQANGIRIHYVRHGEGQPLVLLHGWPEFWYSWHKNIPALAGHFDVIAPDLRGFGDSDKPELPNPPSSLIDQYVEDLRGLADALQLQRIGIVSHDVGAYVAQAFARRYPERLAGLFFFNCPYPGIGSRWIEPDQIQEIWYQTFNQQPWAAALVGSSREACRLYFGNMLRHWSYNPDTFNEDLEAWVDNFLKPGNLQGGFNWYIANREARLAVMRNRTPQMEKIAVPTRVFWGEHDPILKAEWTDRLGDYFSDYTSSPAPGAAHFVHYERPDVANREIEAFFARVWPDEAARAT